MPPLPPERHRGHGAAPGLRVPGGAGPPASPAMEAALRRGRLTGAVAGAAAGGAVPSAARAMEAASRRGRLTGTVAGAAASGVGPRRGACRGPRRGAPR